VGFDHDLPGPVNSEGYILDRNLSGRGEIISSLLWRKVSGKYPQTSCPRPITRRGGMHQRGGSSDATLVTAYETKCFLTQTIMTGNIFLRFRASSRIGFPDDSRAFVLARWGPQRADRIVMKESQRPSTTDFLRKHNGTRSQHCRVSACADTKKQFATRSAGELPENAGATARNEIVPGRIGFL